MTKDEVLALYEDTRKKCFAAAEDADRRPRLSSLEAGMAPLAPYSPDAVAKEAARVDFGERREEVFGGKDKLLEKQAPRPMEIQTNNALHRPDKHRVGKACASPCNSRWHPSQQKK